MRAGQQSGCCVAFCSPRIFAWHGWCTGHPPGLGKQTESRPSSKDGTLILIIEGLQRDEAKGSGSVGEEGSLTRRRWRPVKELRTGSQSCPWA